VSADLSDAARVAKLIRLLSSPVDGEALSAARALCRVLKELNADIHSISDVIEKFWSPPVVVDLFGQQGRSRRDSPSTWWQQLAAELLTFQHDSRIIWGSREIDFLRNVRKSRYAPTAGQEKWLNDIAARRKAA
jgi:hypothetical protein